MKNKNGKHLTGRAASLEARRLRHEFNARVEAGLRRLTPEQLEQEREELAKKMRAEKRAAKVNHYARLRRMTLAGIKPWIQSIETRVSWIEPWEMRLEKYKGAKKELALAKAARRSIVKARRVEFLRNQNGSLDISRFSFIRKD